MDYTGEIGSVGLKEFGGVIMEDLLREWRGQEAVKRANEMRSNSPVVGALLNAIEQSIRGIEWSFTSELGEDDPRLEILNQSIRGMSESWNDHIIEALTFLPFGWAAFEIVYQRVGPNLLWRKFAIRPQDTLLRWIFDDTGGLGGMVQQAAPTYKTTPIPIEKMILYRTRVEKNNPEGRSILRSAWTSYYYAKNISQVEAIGVERDLAGLPVIELPANANVDDNDKNSDSSRANKLVRNIRNDEQAGVVLPNGWKLSLLSTGGSRQFDTDKIINRYESRMLMSCLAQFLMLGQEGVGSLALSSDQTDLFTMSVNATATIISDTVEHFAVPRLLALNGYGADGISFTHTPAGDVDVTKLSTFLQQMAGFITWTTEDEIWLRQIAKLPEIAPEEIQAERDRKEAASQAMMERLTQPNQQDPNSQDPNQDTAATDDSTTDSTSDMGVDYFGISTDKERAAYEKRWRVSLNQFFTGQRERIIAGAKAKKNA